MNPIHTAEADATQTRQFCSVWRCELALKGRSRAYSGNSAVNSTVIVDVSVMIRYDALYSRALEN